MLFVPRRSQPHLIGEGYLRYSVIDIQSDRLATRRRRAEVARVANESALKRGRWRSALEVWLTFVFDRGPC